MKIDKWVCGCGAWLAAERKRRGLAQKDIAKRLGVQQSFIARIENGQRKLGVAELAAYLHVLGISDLRLETVEAPRKRRVCQPAPADVLPVADPHSAAGDQSPQPTASP